MRVRAVAAVAVLLLVVIAGEAPTGAAPTVSGPTTVTGPGPRDAPDAAFDGTSWLVVWNQPAAETGEDVYGRRFSGDGSPLGGAFPIGARPNDDTKPAVAWNGSNFLVVWQHFFGPDWDINARAVSASGVVSPDLYAVAFGGHSEEAPDIAASGTNFLVAWQDNRAPANGYDIWASGRQPSGGTLGEFLVGGEDNGRNDTEPAVAWNGSEFLVVWQHSYQSQTVSDVLAQRTGITQREGFQIFVSDVDFRDDAPAVASNGSDWLVVWGKRGSGTYDLRGERISSTGGQLGEFGISSAAGDQDTPSVAFDGSYLVAWHDRRSSLVPDIYGGRVTSAGAVSDGSGFPISATPATEDSPAVTGGPGTGWGVVLESGTGASTTIALRRVTSSK